jgi:hypothetical protein
MDLYSLGTLKIWKVEVLWIRGCGKLFFNKKTSILTVIKGFIKKD